MLYTLRPAVLKVVVSHKEALGIDPGDMFVPLVDKGHNISAGIAAGCRAAQCPSHHLGHQDGGHSRPGQKDCPGSGQVNTFGEDVHIDQNLQISFPVLLQLSLIVLPADCHTGDRVPEFGYDIVRRNPCLPEQAG